MIKGLMGNQGVAVSGGNVSLPYIGSNVANPIQGMIRINNTDFEVFNGTGWQSLPSSYATVGLDQDTQDLLSWARAQRTMQLNRLTLAQNNPAMLKALEAIKRAEENFELLEQFVKYDKESMTL
jgi:hypothetical protein